MTQTLAQQPALDKLATPDFKKAWLMVDDQLRANMLPGIYTAWVKPLEPKSFKQGVFVIHAINRIGRDWVEDHLYTQMVKLLEAALQQDVVKVSIKVKGDDDADVDEDQDDRTVASASAASARAENRLDTPSTKGRRKSQPDVETTESAVAVEAAGPDGGSPRKIQLHRAYGTRRASVVQPERGMFITMYFFNNWLRLVGHSALTTILAARSMCYWNPISGEKRNVVETDMGELARRAEVSVRTVKAVLNEPLVKQYFLRYRVRRIMTPNGVRTAGIILQVRMDDPLTPEDQEKHNLVEETHWYTADFEDESEDEV